MINKILKLTNKNDTRIYYGYVILDSVLNKEVEEKNRLEEFNRDSSYICVKSHEKESPNRAIYKAQTDINNAISQASDNVRFPEAEYINFSEKDISIQIKTKSSIYYFIELEGK